MLLKSILNQVQKHSGFVYGATRLIKLDGPLVIEVDIEVRKDSRPICSKCGHAGSCYDTLSSRRFEYVPLWGIAVFSSMPCDVLAAGPVA